MRMFSGKFAFGYKTWLSEQHIVVIHLKYLIIILSQMLFYIYFVINEDTFTLLLTFFIYNKLRL